MMKKTIAICGIILLCICGGCGQTQTEEIQAETDSVETQESAETQIDTQTQQEVVSVEETEAGEEKTEGKVMNSVTSLEEFWGVSLEEAETLLGVNFDSEEAQKMQAEPVDSYTGYKLPDLYRIGGQDAYATFYFLDQETPAGNPLGLAIVRLDYDKEIDLKAFMDELTETYGLEGLPSYDYEDGEEMPRSVYWSYQLSDSSVLQKVGEAMQLTLGNDYQRGIVLNIDGRVRSDGTTMVTFSGIAGAFMNHLEDYDGD